MGTNKGYNEIRKINLQKGEKRKDFYRVVSIRYYSKYNS